MQSFEQLHDECVPQSGLCTVVFFKRTQEIVEETNVSILQKIRRCFRRPPRIPQSKEERYVYTFDDASSASCLVKIGNDAANPELSLSWYDAAILSDRVRRTVKEHRARS